MEQNSIVLLGFSHDIKLEKYITEEEKLIIEANMWNLLGKWTDRYTMGDSTSVPVEIAEELLKSICFSLELELKSSKTPSKALIEKDLVDILKSSWNKIEAMMEEGLNLLGKVRKTSLNIGNISYDDTLNEIDQSFKRYDYRFLAHNIECSIDYQLANPISEKLQGIEYINKYLETLLIENEFCKNFNRDNIIEVLNVYCPDYKGLLINIFEPIVTNAIGLDILGEDIFTLEISRVQRNILLDIIGELSKDHILEALRKSVKRICNTLHIENKESIKYIQKTVENIYPRIEVGIEVGNIDNIFLSFTNGEISEEPIFIDNQLMDDEKLRNLIEEMKTCRFTSDKIAMIRTHVSSVGDLVEVMSQCLWGDEAIELFKVLSNDEIYLVQHYLEENKEYSSDSQWEIKLKEYLN